MSRNFKVVVETNNKKDCVFIIRPHLIDFDNFKDEIFIRMPQLKGKPLKYHYEDAEGDRITIFNGLDFGIFLEQELNKIFVAVPCKSFTHDPLCLTNFYSPSTIRGWGTTARGLNDLNRFPFDTQTSIRSVGTTAQEIIKEKIIAKEAQPKEIASTSGNIERPKSPLPSSSKSNEDVLKRMSSAYEKIINEKLTEPDNPLRIEPSLDARIAESLDRMIAMGYENTNGWLKFILDRLNGDISLARNFINQNVWLKDLVDTGHASSNDQQCNEQ